MAYRRRGMKPKKLRRPRVARRKIMRSITSSRYLRIKETFDAGVFTANTGVSLGFSLNSIGQLASYQSLYQKFKITGAKCTFIPHYAPGETNQALANIATGTTSYGGVVRISTSIARGNMSAPGSEIAILQQNHKMHVLTPKGFSVYIKNPVFGVDANPGGVTTETKWTTGFLGTLQSADVIHQGLEWYAAAPGNFAAQYRVFVTLYVTLMEAI